VKWIAALTVLVFLAIPSREVDADHDKFEFKWPWRPTSSATITTYPFSGVHGCYPDGESPYECVAAYDLGIGDRAVVNAKYGAVNAVNVTDGACGSTLGFGTNVDVAGVIYAHLESVTSIALHDVLLQGDQLGVQGESGNVLPCPGGEHLHWGQTIPNTPGVDGGSGQSTNSVIGEFSTMGATLRDYYRTRPFGGWATVGWTHKHCPGTCTLNMTANLTWGRMQDFRIHPDFLGEQFQTVHVAAWDQTHAYLVDSFFWAAWAGGANTVSNPGGEKWPIGMARQERASCPAGSSPSCISFQKFHLGYVWMNSSAVRAAVYCIDIDSNGSTGFGDYVPLLGAWNAQGPPNQSSNWNPQADFDGNNTVGFVDLTRLNASWNAVCRPA
jgi:hypothetical protein